MKNRRKHDRLTACFPIRIDSEIKRDRIGLCRDASRGGFLVATPSRFRVGQAVDLTLMRDSEAPSRVRGRIVRSYTTESPDAGLFCRMLGVAVDSPP